MRSCNYVILGGRIHGFAVKCALQLLTIDFGKCMSLDLNYI